MSTYEIGSLLANWSLFIVAAVGLFLTYRQVKSAADSLKLETRPLIVLEHIPPPNRIGASLWFQFGGKKGNLQLSPWVPKAFHIFDYDSHSMAERGTSDTVSFAIIAFKDVGRAAAIDLHVKLIISYAELEVVTGEGIDTLRYGQLVNEVAGEVVVPCVIPMGATYVGILNRWSGPVRVSADPRATHQNANRETEDVVVAAPIPTDIAGKR